MIFFLDFILIINLFLAYNKFKIVVSPPVLLGGGMLLASLFATFYYTEWNMDQMLLESVLILGFGPLFFTIVCSLFYQPLKFIYVPYYNLNTSKLKVLERLLLIFIISGIFCVVKKYYIILSAFGTDVKFSRLMFLVRTGEDDFSFPPFVNLLLSLNGMISYFSCWILCYLSVNNIRNKRLKCLLAIQILLVILAGGLDGDKAHLFDPILRFIIFYVFLLHTFRATHKLPNTFVKKIGIFVFFIAIGIQWINLLFGRYVDGSSMDMLAQYCGAEIKNFDTFMHSPNSFVNSETWGGETFLYLYGDLGIKVRTAMRFNFINGYELGNVYTQYFSFYKDFGLIGVFVMTIFTAIITMYMYNNAIDALFAKGKLSVWTFLYISICLAIFMSFFSSNITARIIRPSFLRNMLLFYVFISLFEKYILKNNRKIRLSNE